MLLDGPGPAGQSGLLGRMHLDGILLLLLALIAAVGLVTLYSASDGNMAMVEAQAKRLALGLVVLVIVAQCPPDWFRSLAPWAFAVGIGLLILVDQIGTTSKGAQRWLDLGFLRFQPSEIMKYAVPLTIAAFLHDRALPPRWPHLIVCVVLLAIPVYLIGQQPDLGTALLVASAGGFALYFAGIRWRLMLGALAVAAATAPLLWMFVLREYQKKRIIAVLNPLSDPSGAGYHILQSRIAIGSGGAAGKGWLEGTQARLDYLPEANTDFVFAVFAEERGFIGVVTLLALYLLVTWRGLYIAARGQDTFSRLVIASLSLTFFIYVFVNIGMVSGILPVVGVPLPLMSYGGTSMVTLLASFGLMMSLHTHRRLLSA